MKRIPLTLAAGFAALTIAPALQAMPSEIDYPTSTVVEEQLTIDPPTANEAFELQNAGQFAEAVTAWSAIVNAEPKNDLAIFNLGYCLHMEGRLEEAIEYHARAAESDRFRGIALYNLGCAHALMGNTDTSFAMLVLAEEHGFDVKGNIMTDSDLKSLHNDPRMAQFTGQAAGQVESGSAGGSAKADERKQRFAALAQRFAKQALKEVGPMAMEKLGEKYPDMAPVINQVGPMVMSQLNGEQAPPMSAEQQARAEAQAEEAVMQMQHQLSGAVSMFSAQGQQTIQMIEYQIQDAIQNDPRVRQFLHQMVSDPRFGQIMQMMEQMAQQAGGAPRAAQAQGTGNAQLDGALNQARQAAQSGDVETAVMIYKEILKHVPDHPTTTFELGYTLHMAGQIDEAMEYHARAAQHGEYRGIASYNLACAHALKGQRAEAFEALNRAHDAGFDVAGHAPTDPDFKGLRTDQKFKDLMVLFKSGGSDI